MPAQRSKRPLILVTNDDGILADGIVWLAKALESLGEVVVCAPSRQQSAVSHGITLNEPLRVRTLQPGRYAIAGTPADAVFVALSEICTRRPDVVVSGVNHGTNLGTDVFYSGTVAGAMEAALRGIPALAVSQQLPLQDDGVLPQDSEESQKANAWDPLDHLSPRLDALLRQAAGFAAEIVRVLLQRPFPPGLTLNVNGPSQPTQRYCWTSLGRRTYRNSVIRRVDPRGIPYYWIGNAVTSEHDAGRSSDSSVLDAGAFSVTPLRPDWNAAVPDLHDWALEGFSKFSPEPSVCRGE